MGTIVTSLTMGSAGFRSSTVRLTCRSENRSFEGSGPVIKLP